MTTGSTERHKQVHSGNWKLPLPFKEAPAFPDPVLTILTVLL
jgi:hypothetical protein